MLLKLGCEPAQGYGIAHPMPAHELPGWVATWQPDPAWRNSSLLDRDNLSVLHAAVEHRAWVAAIESYIKGERDVPPPLDPRQCRFGMWLKTEQHSTQSAFEIIEPLHRQIHTRATELCELQSQGLSVEALSKLDEVHGLRDALLEQLGILTLKIRQ
jgi:hypothetical protein